MGKQIRLDKYLVDLGLGTRTSIKADVKKGKVMVNDTVAIRPEMKIDIASDKVLYERREVKYETYEYYMLNKPQGCVSATKDNVHKTILDYIDSRRTDLFPVGRLDLDTEGFLLVTNDGNLAHRLLSPKKHVAKTYFARIDGKVTKNDQQIFEQGMDIGEDKPTLPANLRILTADEISEVEITITEGKFHQIKRMFEHVGKEVIYLKRISMGGLILDESLAPGEYKTLTQEDIAQLESRNIYE